MIAGATVTVMLLVCAGIGDGGWRLYRYTSRDTGSGTAGTTHSLGPERLARQVSGTSGILTLTVTSVRVSAAATTVGITAKTKGTVVVTLPILRNCLLLDDARKPYAANGDVTALQVSNQGVSTSVTFEPVPADTQSVTLQCATFFGSMDASGILVTDIPLKQRPIESSLEP
jgi:hypothetical protein